MGEFESYSDEEYGYDTDIIDNMYYEDADYAEEIKDDHTYVLGGYYIPTYDKYVDKIYLGISMSCRLLYNHKIEDVLSYLREYSGTGDYSFRNRTTEVELMQIHYHNEGQFRHTVVVIKTFWLRLIQRTWKKIMKKKSKAISSRKNPTHLQHRELTGRFPQQCYYTPTLKGMLHYLSVKNKKIDNFVDIQQ